MGEANLIQVGQLWQVLAGPLRGDRVRVLAAGPDGVRYLYLTGRYAGLEFTKVRGNRFALNFELVVADAPHLCGTAQTEPVRPVPPAQPDPRCTSCKSVNPSLCSRFGHLPDSTGHVHDPLTMADRATCGPCNTSAETFTRFGKERASALAGNPKDAIGSSKAPTMTVPTTIQAEDGLAMLEGSLKYGRHNYRAAPVRASVYLDAARRHMNRWIEGEEIDPDSGLSHLAKARACFGIIRDAQICGTLIDDRPPPAPVAFFAECDQKAAALVAKYPNPVPPYVANDPRLGERTAQQISSFLDANAPRDAIEVELDALKARTQPR